jgi:uncharacterized protein YgbK (DUF1537 family)
VKVQTVRILADDLTGALDSAVRFSGDVGPFHVAWDMDAAGHAKSLAFSSESRDLDEEAAMARSRDCAAILRPESDIAFKKIDSLLRGHIAAELAAILSQGQFDAVVLAPAFPALGRVTRSGRQWVRYTERAEHQIVGPDLADDLARFDVVCHRTAEHLRSASVPAVWLADAETDDDLEGIVTAGRALPGRVLWCGTGGLAGTLAARPEEVLTPHAASLLVVSGSNHAVAGSQVRTLIDIDEARVVSCEPGAEDRVADALRRRLHADPWTALVPALPTLSESAASLAIEAMLARILPKLDKPDAIFVMGGETLHACCEALSAHSLVVRGSYAPGIPVSTIEGGPWDGVTVLSKSGAFGGADTLSNLIRGVTPDPRRNRTDNNQNKDIRH